MDELKITVDQELESLVPPLTAVEFEALRADIEQHGVQVPIVVDENGVVLDGHHRFRIAGQDCPRRIVEGLTTTEQKKAYVLRAAVVRRNLSVEQRATLTGKQKSIIVALRAADPKKWTQEALAVEVGVSQSTVCEWLKGTIIDADNGSAPDGRRKITPEQEVAIVAAAETGEKPEDLAKEYGITARYVRKLLAEERDQEPVKLQAHPIAELLRERHGREYERFRADIAKRGLRHPITLFEGMILDGRSRYRACRDLGIEPKFEQYDGDDAIGFVIGENISRYSEGQRAMAAVGMMELWEKVEQPEMQDGLPVHPALAIIPQFVGPRYENFKADIAKHGLLQPIVMHEGQILDGRARLRACRELKIEPKFEQYTGDSPAGFVLAQNITGRAHYSEDEIAAAEAQAEKYREMAATEAEARD